MTDVVLNLGGGVQSTTMLLMAARGELEPMPVLAVFADTGSEREATYAHLEFLQREVGERIEVVTTKRRAAGQSSGDLKLDVQRAAAGEITSLSTPPVFARRPDGRPGPTLRKCTRDYKIRPIEQELRRRGFGPDRPVEQWIGLSVDEVERMNRSGFPSWATVRWPLIEKGMSRHDCEFWLERNGYYTPPKSACTFCPHHSDHAWRDLRDNSPEEWEEAVDVDRMVRNLPGLNGEAFLHRSMVPLDQVELRSPEERGQMSLEAMAEWDAPPDECGGGCFT